MAVRSIFSSSEGGVYVDGVKSQTFTLDVGLQQACVLLPFLSFCYMISIDIHSRVDKGATVESCRINPLPFCRRFGIACIFPTGSSTCTRSVFCCVRPSRNENQHWISTWCCTGYIIYLSSLLVVRRTGNGKGKTVKRMWCVCSSMLSVKFLKNLLVKT